MSTDTSIITSQAALKLMAEGKWITYLPTANIEDGISSLLLNNDYFSLVFNKSIYATAKDDFTINQIPGCAIYRINKSDNTRLGLWKGDIHFDLFFPLFIDGISARKIFGDILEALILTLQDGRFMMALHDYLVPLPSTLSPFYQDVVDYKKNQGSALMQFAKNIKYETPYKKNLKDIGDVWHCKLITDYEADRFKFNQLLQNIGIDFLENPNKMIYGNMDSFNYDITLENIENTQTQNIEG